MNYAWEAVLAADRLGIPREEIRYVPVGNGSPYTEIVQEMVNGQGVGEKNVEINPLYRFSREFSRMFDINLEGYGQTREIFFDCCMHCLAEQDLRQGLSKQEYALRFLLQDFLNGVWGKEAKQAVCQFERGKLRQLLRLILKLYQCGNSRYLFREVMRAVYPGSLVYVSNEAIHQVLVYLGRKPDEREQKRMKFLQDMFLPVSDELYLFWENHFGIMDVEETMVLDKMVLL